MQTRVLFVEDRPRLLRHRIDFLTDAGFSADGAQTKEEALEKIRRRAYHVALIDINLTDHSGQGGDRQGLEIVRHLKELGEGTACIVISAEENVEVPVRSQELGVERYFLKREIDEPADFIEPTKQIAAEVRLVKYGKFDNQIAYLAWHLKRWDWEAQAMFVLGGGIERIYNAIKVAFEGIEPVLPPKNSMKVFPVNQSSGFVSGYFWSRALGECVEVALAKSSDIESYVPKAESELILASEKQKIGIRVWRISLCSRDEFIETTFDLK